jgi:hypothetical protein
MNLQPIRYYLQNEVSKSTLDFADARKGKLIHFFYLEGENYALFVDDKGEVRETLAGFIKVIGDDTKRTLAQAAENIKNLKEYYVPQSLHLQFEKDVDKIKELLQYPTNTFT